MENLGQKSKRGVYVKVGSIALSMIVFSIICFLFIITKNSNNNNKYNSIDKNIHSLHPGIEKISKCLKNELQSNIEVLSLGGGFLHTKPAHYINFYDSEFSYDLHIPYYYYNGQNHMPKISHFEIELDQAMVYSLEHCIEHIPCKYKYRIDYQSILIESKIKDKYISSNILLPINFILHDSYFHVENFDLDIDSYFYDLFHVAKKISEANYNEKRSRLVMLSKLEKKHNINIKRKLIRDNKDDKYAEIYSLKKNDLRYLFAVQYDRRAKLDSFHP